MNAGNEARRYLRTREFGVLSTLSASVAGYPFGSIAPFALDHAARPLILISALAEHRKNIDADRRVSLLIHDGGEDAQALARLTLVGDAAAIEPEAALRERYLRYSPQAKRLLALGDFQFYRIAPVAIRFIAGFGAVHWVKPEDFAPPLLLQDLEPGILASVNAQDRQILHDCCRSSGADARDVELIGIDCDGFDLRADGRRRRFQFEAPLNQAAEARQAMIRVATAGSRA